MDKTYTLYILENKLNGKRYVGQTTRPLKARKYCVVCGKDKTMGYDPDLDFRYCPSCRHAKHLSQDLGISELDKAS